MKYQLVKNSAWKEVEVNGEMVEIPEDWSVCTFKDIGSFKTGKSYSKNIGDSYNVYGSSSVPMSVKSSEPLYMKDSFIIGRKGTIDKPFKVKGPFWCVDTAMFFETTIADINFLFHLTKKIDWLRYSTGTTVPSLVQSQVNKIQVTIPQLAEQSLISGILTEQETLIANYNTLIAQHQQRLDYLSDELLSGRIRLQGGEQGEPYTMVKNTKWKEVEVNGEMVEIPEDWDVDKLKNLVKMSSGGTPSRDEHYGGNIPWITTTDLNNGVIRRTLSHINETGLKESSAKVIPEGAVLFAMYGSIGKMGISGVSATTNQSIAAMVVGEKIQNFYLFQHLLKKKENVAALGGGSILKNISQTILKEFSIFFPCVSEQIKIANVLNQQENLITQYKTLRDLEQKRFAWLSDALLSGTYRVKELP